jgi:DNA-binding response OmpR family regulator
MNPFSVILVEDDFELGRLFQEVLEMGGLKVEWIRDGRLALQRLAEVAPELLVLDLHLPEVSGMDILQFIRQDERFAHMRIAVVTADGLRAQMIEDQVDLVMLKPVGMNQLLDLVKRLSG